MKQILEQEDSFRVKFRATNECYGGWLGNSLEVHKHKDEKGEEHWYYEKQKPKNWFDEIADKNIVSCWANGGWGQMSYYCEFEEVSEDGHINYPDDMDKECIPLCDLFNSIGLTTKFSCCGHGESPFQIIFDDTVTDEQIYHCIKVISQGRDHTPIVGSFLKWTRKVDDKIASNWTYQVDKIVWANLDLESIQEHI